MEDEEKVAQVVEAARTSMGMDLTELDLANIERFGMRVASLTEYRTRLHEYIQNRMENCAPSLSTLIGEQVNFSILINQNDFFCLGWRSFDFTCWIFNQFG